MFNGEVYIFIFIDDSFEFGCYANEFRDKFKLYVDTELKYDKCIGVGIDNNGDLDISLYFKTVE